MRQSQPAQKQSAFRAYEPGYLHIDLKYLPQMADEMARCSLFVAIDRAIHWVFVRIYKAKTAANARRFLRDLARACPLKIRKILIDKDREFTDRLFGLHARSASVEHEFDALCSELGIEHRLSPPKHPQSEAVKQSLWESDCRPNGMVERFNGRIEDVLQSHHSDPVKNGRPHCCDTSGSTTKRYRNRPLDREHPCSR